MNETIEWEKFPDCRGCGAAFQANDPRFAAVATGDGEVLGVLHERCVDEFKASCAHETRIVPHPANPLSHRSS